MKHVRRIFGFDVSSQAGARRRAGFSLIEMLAAITILLLVGMIAVAGIPAAQRAYVAAMDSSNAQILLSTTTTRLRDVLSVANPATVEVGQDGALVSFESYETGFRTQIVNDEDQGLCVVETPLKETGATPMTTPLVPLRAGEGAHGSDLRVVVDEDGGGGISWDAARGVFTVSQIRVMREGAPLPDAEIDSLSIGVLAVPRGSS